MYCKYITSERLVRTEIIQFYNEEINMLLEHKIINDSCADKLRQKHHHVMKDW